MVCRTHRLCVLFHLGSGHKGGRKEELDTGLTGVSCSHHPRVSLSQPLRVTHSPRLGQLQDIQDLLLPLARGEADDSGEHHQDPQWSLDVPTSQLMGQGLLFSFQALSWFPISQEFCFASKSRTSEHCSCQSLCYPNICSRSAVGHELIGSLTPSCLALDLVLSRRPSGKG